jgi:hypothetical protein
MYRLGAWLMLWCLLVLPYDSLYAANKIYVAPEAVLVFGDAGQVGLSAQLTLTNLLAGTGRMSTLLDRGATAHSAWYKWRCRASLTGTNSVGQSLEIYLGTSDGTNPDGQLSTTDGALTTEKRRNLLLLGVLVVDQTTTDTIMAASGLVYVVDRFLAVGVWNGTSLPLTTSPTAHRCTLTPWPQEVQ